MRPFLLLVACFLSTSVFSKEPLQGRLPEDFIPQLREVIASAMQGSETLLQRGYLETESEGRRLAARSAVLPSFRSGFAFRQEKDIDDVDGNGFENRVVYNVTLSQPLYHWGDRRSQKEIGELQYELEKLNTQIVASNVVTQVRRDFMNLLVAKQRWKRSQLDLEQAISTRDFQRKQVEAGAAAESSLERLDLDVERQELQTLRVETDWEMKLEDLANYVSMDPARLSGLVVGVVPQVDVLAQEEIDSLVAYYSLAIETDERIQQSAIDIEINKKQVQMAKNSLLPKVDAELGLSSNALDLDGTRREQEYSYFGLSVGWTIFDGFRKRGKTMEALSRLSRAERTKRLGQERLVSSFDRRLRQLSIQGRGLAIEERVLAASLKQLDEAKRAVQEQRAPVSTEQNAQRDYDNTLIRTQESRISYLDTLSQVASELGLD